VKRSATSRARVLSAPRRDQQPRPQSALARGSRLVPPPERPNRSGPHPRL
jgi:hypothetical protein